MRRRKFFLSTLAILLGITLVGCWTLFLTGRFSLVADLLLPSVKEEKQEFSGQDLLSRSYFENLQVKDGKIKVSSFSVEPELSLLQKSQVALVDKAVITATEPSVQTAWGVRARRRNTNFLVVKIENKTDQYIAPFEMRLPPIQRKDIKYFGVYGPYLEWLQDNRYRIRIDHLSPKETKTVGFLVVGMEKSRVEEELVPQIELYGKIVPFSLAEDYEILNCSEDCGLSVGGKRVALLAKGDLPSSFVADLGKSAGFYLQRIDLRLSSKSLTVVKGEVGIRFKTKNLNYLPLSGRVEKGIWYLPVKDLVSQEKAKFTFHLQGWMLANAGVIAEDIVLAKLRLPKNYPLLSSFWSPDQLKALVFAKPDEACLTQEAYRCDKYHFTSLEQTPAFMGKVNNDQRLLTFYQLQTRLGTKSNQYQKVLAVPYLSGKNADLVQQVLNAQGFFAIDNDTVLDPVFWLYPRNSVHAIQVLSVLRQHQWSSGDANFPINDQFLKGDYLFYGIKNYRGLLWTEIDVPSATHAYRLSLAWSDFKDKGGKVVVQARSWVGGEFTDWSTLGAGTNSFDIAAGTEKVQLRVFIEGSDPKALPSLGGVRLVSAATPAEKGGEDTGQPPATSNETPLTSGLNQGLISTGTHLLLLLIISVILVVSIVYIVALIKEE